MCKEWFHIILSPKIEKSARRSTYNINSKLICSYARRVYYLFEVIENSVLHDCRYIIGLVF